MEVLNKGHPIRGWPIDKATDLSSSTIFDCFLAGDRQNSLMRRGLTRRSPTEIGAMLVNNSICVYPYEYNSNISGHCKRKFKSEVNSHGCRRCRARKSIASLLIGVAIRKHILGVRFIRAPGIMQRRPIIGCVI